MKMCFLAVILLAGCNFQGDAHPEPTAQHFKERHPDWPMEDCERLASGTIWRGMTEKQFLYLMKRRTHETEWQITQSEWSRVYQRPATQEIYVIDLSTGRLADWVQKER